ncbi:MAG: hypothetical protein R2695_09285 [Acidimicrobiales bacterium]
MTADGAWEIARRSRGTPVSPTGCCARSRDYAEVEPGRPHRRRCRGRWSDVLRGRHVGPRQGEPGRARRHLPAIRRGSCRPLRSRSQ